MSFQQQTIGSVPATRIVQGTGTEAQSPMLITNLDSVNSLFLGDDASCSPTDSNNAAPLPALASVVVDGRNDVYAVTLPNVKVGCALYPGGINFFQLVELLLKTLLISSSAGNGIFVYQGAPGLGNLVGSFTANGGVDPFGNVTKAGLVVYGTGGAAIQLAAQSGLTFLNFYTGSVHELDSASFEAATVASSFMSIVLKGAVADNQIDQAFIQLNSAPFDSSASANGDLLYADTTGSDHLQASWGALGFNSQNATVQGVDPTTGTVAVPAQPENWHPMALNAGWTALAGHPTPSYKRLAETNEVHIVGFAQHAAFNGVVTIATLPVGYRPITAQSIPNTGDATNPSGQIAVLTNGVVETSVFPNAGSTQVTFNGTFPINL